MKLSTYTKQWVAGSLLVALLALSGCGAGNASSGTDAASNTSTNMSTSASTTTATLADETSDPVVGADISALPLRARKVKPAPTPTPTPSPTDAVYTITVYYTAVESFHTDAKINVSGCLIRECAFGKKLIGNYPASFIKATKTEGTGRITSGVNAGKYLNWSVDVGYWLDTIPSDGYGTALVPFRTAAADDIALTRGTQFKLLAPLIQDDGSALDSVSANKLLAAQWLINDQFTPGLGGALHLDLYIGEENMVNFTNKSPMYLTLMNTKIARL
jgi:hypothetical protein